MNEEYEYRYIFTVRQSFGKEPSVDSFYQLTVPPGISGDQARIMTTLSPDWCRKEINEDGNAMKGMNLRLRFNTDMYQHICMVNTVSPINADQLDAVIKMKHREGELLAFLDDAKLA